MDPANLDLPVLVSIVGQTVDRHVLSAVRHVHPGIRASHGYVFQRLLQGPSTVTEIARDLRVSQQAVSKLVKELVALGFVVRIPDPHDKRVRRLELTNDGRDAVDLARRVRAELAASVAAHLDVPAARAVLVALLEAAGGLDAVREASVPLPEP